MYDVFISYSRIDSSGAARQIADRLFAEGFSVFLDSNVLVGGGFFSDGIHKQIKEADAVLALLSSQSRKSKWVEEELQVALKSKQLVLPVLLDRDAKNNWLWPLLANRQSIVLDFSSAESKSQLDELVRVLSERIGKPRTSSSSRPRELWGLVALLAVAIGALVTWLLVRSGP